MGAVHAGRKANGFRIVSATKAVDQRFEAGDDLLELAAAAIKAVNAVSIRRPAAKSLSSRVTAYPWSLPQKACFDLVNEQHVRRIGKNTIVGDHQLRRLRITQMTAKAERRAVLVAKNTG